LDIVTPNQDGIGVAINTSSNILSFTLKTLTPYESPFAVELTEMNGDDKIDLIVASYGNSITVIPGDGNGNFLEEDTTLYPGHDYKGWTSSTLKEEKQHNPRLQFANKKSYADFMMNLQLPNPKLMDIAVPANQACGNS